MTFVSTIQTCRSASTLAISLLCLTSLSGCAGMATGTSSVNPERKSEVITIGDYSFEIMTESYVDDLRTVTDEPDGPPYHPTITTRTVFTPDGQRHSCSSRAECIRIGEASIANAPPIPAPAPAPTADRSGGGGGGGGGGEG